jgi:hypothetical protein
MKSGPEVVENIRLLMMVLKELTDEPNALAGVILTGFAYDKVKTLFGANAISYRPGELDLDPEMEHSFVVDGLLILRGTQLQ